MRKKLEEILNRGVIRNEEDFRIFWLFHTSIDEILPTEHLPPVIYADLLYGYACIGVHEIGESQLTAESMCRFYCDANEPIMFFDHNKNEFPTHEALLTANMERISKNYKMWIGDEFTIEYLNSQCDNYRQWKNGGNYTTFMAEGRIQIGLFKIGNSYKTMYAKIKPLSDYEVVETEVCFLYEDCYVLVEDVYIEDAKEE